MRRISMRTTWCRWWTGCSPFTHGYGSFQFTQRTASFMAHHDCFLPASRCTGVRQGMVVGGLNSRLCDKEENKCHFTRFSCFLSLSLIHTHALPFCIGIECFLLPLPFLSLSYALSLFSSLSLSLWAMHRLWTSSLYTYTTVFDNILFPYLRARSTSW